MTKRMFKKGLVVGIIILFISVGIQPTVANDISISMLDDTTPPAIEVTVDIYKDETGWYVDFICVTYDSESGIDRLEWYVDGLLDNVIKDPPREYIFEVNWYENIDENFFWFFAYNGAGLSAYVEIDGSDIPKSRLIDIGYAEDCDCQEDSDNRTICTKLMLGYIVNYFKVGFWGIMNVIFYDFPMIWEFILKRASDIYDTLDLIDAYWDMYDCDSLNIGK